MVAFNKIKEELIKAWEQVGADYKNDRILNEMDVVASFYHHLRSWLDKDETLRMFTNLRVSRDRPSTRNVRNIDCALIEYNLSESKECMFNRFLLMLEFKCKIHYQRNYYQNVIKEDINKLSSFLSSNKARRRASGPMGSFVTLIPVASCMALATAAAVGMMGCSPRPLAP